MKCISHNKGTGASATSSATGYPAANVLDRQDHPWKADAQEATLTLNVAAGSSGIGLAGIKNSLNVRIVVKDHESEVVADETIDLSGVLDWYQFFIQSGLTMDRYGMSYPYQMRDHTIEITVDSGSNEVYPGIDYAFPGSVRIWPETMKLSMSLIRRGIKSYYHDKGVRYIHRKPAKQFTGDIRVGLYPDFWAWIEQIAIEVGEEPIFWWITDQDAVYWSILGGFDPLPSAKIFNKVAVGHFGIREEVKS